MRILATIRRGQGRPDGIAALRNLPSAMLRTVTFATLFRERRLVSLLHGFVGWGFIYYLLVNLADLLQAFLPGYAFLESSPLGGPYRLGADLLSACVLIGMAALILRRFVLGDEHLELREGVLLHEKARRGVRRDSAIVGAFILLHVGARLMGESFHLAQLGGDVWQPVATTLSRLWVQASPPMLEVGRHAGWWLSMGSILVFLPYFLYSKHLHLIVAPINEILRPRRLSLGALDPMDFEDQSIEHFGASYLEHLPWKGMLDAYACIMCNRCQDACPAYATGKVLSPAALEINKRYFLNQEGARMAAGEPTSQALVEFALPEEAVWACTACGACVDVCPVGNEPMFDIIEIRRHMVLMENAFPETLQAAYRSMERTANIWGIPPEQRMDWAEGLPVPTVDAKPQAEVLWWVGCAPATDARAQKTARALVKVLEAAGVDYAVLGQRERCTGDSARRSGNEYLFEELARANIETLNQVAPKRILTTCPHCLHTLKNEYPAFGGEYEVVHHSQFLAELLEAGRLKLAPRAEGLTFHDPCYLGRQNGIYADPRRVLAAAGANLTEMPRAGRRSFCCGAGGAQMWKEEEPGELRVSTARLREATATGQSTLAVGCPFCMIMLEDAAGAEASEIEIRDLVEIIADRIDPETKPPSP